MKKTDIEKFKNFRNSYDFKYKEIVVKDDEKYIGETLVSNSDGTVSETEEFINVGYKLKGPYSKVLSNIFPYTFTFRGKKVNSLEAIFQAIKFKDVKMQNLVLKYDRLDANNIKVATPYDWKETGILYWQGKEIDRFSSDYDDFTVEMYLSAIKNPLYKSVLKNIDKYILHSIGEEDSKKTVFTRYEFERMLNTLSAYVKREK